MSVCLTVVTTSWERICGFKLNLLDSGLAASFLLVPPSQCGGMNTHSEGQRLGDCLRRIKVDFKDKLTMLFLTPCCALSIRKASLLF